MPPVSPTVSLILQGILAAVQAAPLVEEVITSAKNMISSLVTAKLISTDVQNMLHLFVDNNAALAKAGIVPPGWSVDPDPK